MLTRRRAWGAAFLIVCAGCVASGPNEVRRARLEQRDAADDRAAARRDRDAVAVELEIDERESEIGRLHARLDRVRDEQAGLIGELDAALRTVEALEEDLVAARARQQEIEAQLAPIRALEAELAALDARQAELAATREARAAELAALAAREAELDAELETKRAAAEARARAVLAEIERIGEVGATLEAALEILAPRPPQPADEGQRSNDSK